MVISKKTKIIILSILLALTLCFIWGNSLLPATISGQISDAVKETLRKILPEGFFRGTGMDDGGLIRKLAHYAEFTALGLELALLLWYTLETSLTAPLFLGLLTALTDETIQLFIEGRGSSIRDVWIDFGGVVTGTVIIVLIRRSQRARSQRRKKSQFAVDKKKGSMYNH